jgi:hypothetical protein
LVHSHALNVCAIDVLQLVQLVGFDALPNATCTPHAIASVAQVVFKVTDVLFVATASLLIVKLPHVGAAVSIVVVTLVLHALVFCRLSLLLTKKKYCCPLLNDVNVAPVALNHHDEVHDVTVLVVFLQNSYCTHPTSASVDHVVVTVTDVLAVKLGNAANDGVDGGAVSNTIVSVTSALILPKLSLHLI